MTDRDRDTDNESEILTDEQIEEGKASPGDDMAFSDRWDESELFAELQNRFGHHDLDWEELKGIGSDRAALAAKISEATGLTEEAVREQIDEADQPGR